MKLDHILSLLPRTACLGKYVGRDTWAQSRQNPVNNEFVAPSWHSVGYPTHSENCWANVGPSRDSLQLIILGGPSWGLYGRT